MMIFGSRTATLSQLRRSCWLNFLLTQKRIIGNWVSVKRKSLIKLGLINMLATYKRDDEIFSKGYVAPASKKKKPDQKTISVQKTLFDGLPQKNWERGGRRHASKLLKMSNSFREICDTKR
jgi:hypothetical protein